MAHIVNLDRVVKSFNVTVGIYENMLITVSYPCSEIALWDKNTLEKRRVIKYDYI